MMKKYLLVGMFTGIDVLIVFFADENLKQYEDNLIKMREILVTAKNTNSLDQEEKKKIIGFAESGLQVIENARYNTIPVFGENSTGEEVRIVPVILDAGKPSYKILISCVDFNRPVINVFIGNLSKDTGNNVEEVDKILSSVNLERAKLDAYKKRLSYSVQVAAAVSNKNITERQSDLHKVTKTILTEQIVLCVQAANGIYCAEDRNMIQFSVDELGCELNRISELQHKATVDYTSISVRTQADAEKAMLYLAKKGRL